MSLLTSLWVCRKGLAWHLRSKHWKSSSQKFREGKDQGIEMRLELLDLLNHRVLVFVELHIQKFSCHLLKNHKCYLLLPTNANQALHHQRFKAIPSEVIWTSKGVGACLALPWRLFNQVCHPFGNFVKVFFSLKLETA